MSQQCRSLKLPFTFDAGQLRSDLSACTHERWQAHFNTNDYTGDWRSVSLYSASGKTEDIATIGETFHPTPLLSKCTYVPLVLNEFRCEFEAVRLLNLAPGSVIHEHRDRGLAYPFGVFRLHIPIITADEVDFIVGGENLHMQAGECWYANFDLPHSVNNRGAGSRVHLVIDCKRNEWSDQVFAQSGYDFNLERKLMKPDSITRSAMIAELERMGTDTANKLIAELKASADED